MMLECAYCHRLWRRNAVKFYDLNDNMVLCEHCAEELFNDMDLTEDCIDFVTTNF